MTVFGLSVGVLLDTSNWRRKTPRAREMAMAAHMRMAVPQATVTMFKHVRHPRLPMLRMPCDRSARECRALPIRAQRPARSAHIPLSPTGVSRQR